MSAVVGIDLSLTSTGLAYVNDRGQTELTNFGRKGKRNESLAQRGERLQTLEQNVVAWVIAGEVPDLVVIESPSFGSVGGSAWDRAGAWWGVVNELLKLGILVTQVAPTTRAKYATGSGRADKATVMAHLDLSAPGADIRNDDQADALVLAMMGARYMGYPLEDFTPGSDNLSAMESMKWPISL